MEQQVPLSQITVSHNPRKSHRGLLELFHEKGASHNAPEVRAEFVKHIDENFTHIRERAESFKSVGQLQAGLLRSFRAKIPGSEEYTERYGIAAGECRAMAWGLIEAETGEPQRLRAVVEKLTVDEAFERGIAERTDMSPLDLAEAFNEMLTVRVNPATKVAELPDGSPNPLYDPSQPKGRPYSMRELAEKVKKDYHWVRSRAALVYLPVSGASWNGLGRKGGETSPSFASWPASSKLRPPASSRSRGTKDMRTRMFRRPARGASSLSSRSVVGVFGR